MTTTRRFELEEGTSSKFWEIRVEGVSHTVRFGRIGTSGQTKTKSFASATEAESDADKLVKEKLRKGYREVKTAAPAPPPRAEPPVPRRTEAAVRTKLKPPRGKKPIVFTLSGSSLDIDGARQSFESAVLAKKALDALVRARTSEGYSLGSVEILEAAHAVAEEAPIDDEPYEPDPDVSHDEQGRLRISFEGDEQPTTKLCAKAVACINEEHATAVHVLGDIEIPGDAWAAAVAKQKMPSVKAFIFDTYFMTQGQQRENSLGDLRATLDALPSLERFFATGDLEIGKKGTHATLRELHLLGDPLTPEFLRALATWSFPALERVVLSLTADAFVLEDSGAAILRALGLDAPRLRAVYVDGLHDAVHTLEKLLASKPAAKLKEIALEGSVDEDALIRAVERHAAMLGKLDVLALPLSEVSTDAGAKLRALCPALCDFAEMPRLTLPSAYETWTGTSSS